MLRLAIGIIVVASAHGALAASAVATPDPFADDVAGKAHAGSAAASAGRANAGAPARLPTARQPAASDNPLWAVPLSALSATGDRPIFSSSRRPPPAAVDHAAVPKAAAAPKAKEPERPKLSLVGTIANSLEQFGIFLDQSTAAAIRLRVGEEFQGWKLSSVQGRDATLEKDRQSVVLSLPQPGGTKPAELSRVNLATQPMPGQPQLPSAPQPRRHPQPLRQM
jgi:general secretion pathway protein N